MKYIKYIAGILVLFVVILAGWFLIREKTQREIPLVDNAALHFGDSPADAQKALGAPMQVVPNVADTGKTYCEYDAVLLGKNASVACYFADDKSLSEMIVHWSLDSDTANALFSEAETLLERSYQGRENFFHNERSAEADGTVSTSLGVFDGAAGITYTLNLSYDEVVISCRDEG